MYNSTHLFLISDVIIISYNFYYGNDWYNMADDIIFYKKWLQDLNITDSKMTCQVKMHKNDILPNSSLKQHSWDSASM